MSLGDYLVIAIYLIFMLSCGAATLAAMALMN
jgi:hypothetical protein